MAGPLVARAGAQQFTEELAMSQNDDEITDVDGRISFLRLSLAKIEQVSGPGEP
jgi:hypothetical protein